MLLVALALFLQVGPLPPMPPPQPPVQVTTEVREVHEHNLIAPKPDPQMIAEASVESSRAQLAMVVAPPPIAWANELLNLPDLWRQTPPDLTYNHPAVRERSNLMWAVAGGILALAVLGWGAAKALGQHPSEGRFVLAIVLALGSLTWWEIGISLNNAICAAIGAPDLPGLIRPHLTLPDPTADVGAIVLVIVYVFVALMLLFSLLFRLGMLMILIAVGPLALLMYALPQSEGLAQKYVSHSVGLLFSQVLIVLGLSLAQVLSSAGTGLAGSLLGIIMLLILRRLPSLLTTSLERGGRSMVGTIATMVAFRRFR